MTPLPFSSPNSEPRNGPGHPSSLQKCQIPKHHGGKVHEAPRPGGLWAEQVSVSVPGEGMGERGEQKLPLEGALIQQFPVKAKVWTGPDTVLDRSLADNLHVKV